MPLGRQAARSSCTRGGDEGEGDPRRALHSGQAEHLPLASRQVPATAACPVGAYANHHSSVILNSLLCLLPEPSSKSDLSQVLRKTLSLRVAFICLSLVLVAMIVLQAVFCKSPGFWRPKLFFFLLFFLVFSVFSGSFLMFLEAGLLLLLSPSSWIFDWH